VPDNEARLGYLPCGQVTPAPNPCPSSGLANVGVNSAVAPLLNLWPVENGPELLSNGNPSGIAEAFSHPPQHIREDFGTTRFDSNLSGKDLLFAVYTVDASAANFALGKSTELHQREPARAGGQHSGAACLSPSLLNTARFGYSRASFFFTGLVPITGVPGWVSGEPVGAIVISGSTASNGASAITGAGANTGSNNRTARNLFTEDDHIYWSQRPPANRSRRLASAHTGQRSARAGPIRPGLLQHGANLPAGHRGHLHSCSRTHRAGLAFA
jgi:hypothetical protein